MTGVQVIGKRKTDGWSIAAGILALLIGGSLLVHLLWQWVHFPSDPTFLFMVIAYACLIVITGYVTITFLRAGIAREIVLADGWIGLRTSKGRDPELAMGWADIVEVRVCRYVHSGSGEISRIVIEGVVPDAHPSKPAILKRIQVPGNAPSLSDLQRAFQRYIPKKVRQATDFGIARREWKAVINGSLLICGGLLLLGVYVLSLRLDANREHFSIGWNLFLFTSGIGTWVSVALIKRGVLLMGNGWIRRVVASEDAIGIERYWAGMKPLVSWAHIRQVRMISSENNATIIIDAADHGRIIIDGSMSHTQNALNVLQRHVPEKIRQDATSE